MKLFTYYLEKYFRELNESIQHMAEGLEKTNTMISNIKFEPTDKGFTYTDSIGCVTAYNTLDILASDYFTKEYLNGEATNTKVLYVIENGHMQQFYFKEGNESKEVQVIDGNNYLFKQ